MPDGRLLLPGVRVCVDVGVDGGGGGAVAVAVCFAVAEGWGGGVGGRGGGGCGGGFVGVDHFAVAFEDLFCCDVGGVVVEGRVVEDGLDVFGDLGNGVSRGWVGGEGFDLPRTFDRCIRLAC